MKFDIIMHYIDKLYVENIFLSRLDKSISKWFYFKILKFLVKKYIFGGTSLIVSEQQQMVF